MNEVLQMNVISPAVVVAPTGVVDLALVALSVDPNAVPSTDETAATGDDDGRSSRLTAHCRTTREPSPSGKMKSSMLDARLPRRAGNAARRIGTRFGAGAERRDAIRIPDPCRCRTRGRCARRRRRTGSTITQRLSVGTRRRDETVVLACARRLRVRREPGVSPRRRRSCSADGVADPSDGIDVIVVHSTTTKHGGVHDDRLKLRQRSSPRPRAATARQVAGGGAQTFDVIIHATAHEFQSSEIVPCAVKIHRQHIVLVSQTPREYRDRHSRLRVPQPSTGMIPPPTPTDSVRAGARRSRSPPLRVRSDSSTSSPSRNPRSRSTIPSLRALNTVAAGPPRRRRRRRRRLLFLERAPLARVERRVRVPALKRRHERHRPARLALVHVRASSRARRKGSQQSVLGALERTKSRAVHGLFVSRSRTALVGAYRDAREDGAIAVVTLASPSRRRLTRAIRESSINHESIIPRGHARARARTAAMPPPTTTTVSSSPFAPSSTPSPRTSCENSWTMDVNRVRDDRRAGPSARRARLAKNAAKSAEALRLETHGEAEACAEACEAFVRRAVWTMGEDARVPGRRRRASTTTDGWGSNRGVDTRDWTPCSSNARSSEDTSGERNRRRRRRCPDGFLADFDWASAPRRRPTPTRTTTTRNDDDDDDDDHEDDHPDAVCRAAARLVVRDAGAESSSVVAWRSDIHPRALRASPRRAPPPDAPRRRSRPTTRPRNRTRRRRPPPRDRGRASRSRAHSLAAAYARVCVLGVSKI